MYDAYNKTEYLKRSVKLIVVSVILFLVGWFFYEGTYNELWLLIEIIGALMFAIMVDYLISKEFEFIAIEKGYQEKRYFWYPFVFGIVGYLLVIALPYKCKTDNTLTTLRFKPHN